MCHAWHGTVRGAVNPAPDPPRAQHTFAGMASTWNYAGVSEAEVTVVGSGVGMAWVLNRIKESAAAHDLTVDTGSLVRRAAAASTFALDAAKAKGDKAGAASLAFFSGAAGVDFAPLRGPRGGNGKWRSKGGKQARAAAVLPPVTFEAWDAFNRHMESGACTTRHGLCVRPLGRCAAVALSMPLARGIGAAPPERAATSAPSRLTVVLRRARCVHADDGAGVNDGLGTFLELSLLARELTGTMGIAVVDARSGEYVTQPPFCHPSSPRCVRFVYARPANVRRHAPKAKGRRVASAEAPPAPSVARVVGEHTGHDSSASPAAPLPTNGPAEPACGDARQHSPDRPSSGKSHAAVGPGDRPLRQSQPTSAASSRCKRPADRSEWPSPGDSGHGGSPPPAMPPLVSPPPSVRPPVDGVRSGSSLTTAMTKTTSTTFLRSQVEDRRWPAKLSRRPARVSAAAEVLRTVVSVISDGTAIDSEAFFNAVCPTCRVSVDAASRSSYPLCTTGFDLVHSGGGAFKVKM